MNHPASSRLERWIAWPLLCLFVFTIPWEKSIFVAGLGTITRVLGLALFAAGAAAAVWRRSVRFPNLALVLATAFTCWASLSYFWSVEPADSALRVRTFVQLLAMLWLVWDLCRTPGQQRTLIQAYVAGSMVSSVWTIVRYSENLQTYYRRYAAAGFEPNDMALTLALVIPLAMYLALDGHPLARWLYRIAAALAISALLLTASRTGLVVCTVAFVFAVWTWRKSSLEQKLANLALLVILVSGTGHFAPPTSRARLATLPAEATTGTLHQRTQIWAAGLKIIQDHPLLGVGIGGYPEGARPYLASVGLPNAHYVAHNTYLSVLAECGLIGFAIYALWLLVQAVYVWALPFAERALWSVTLAVWAVGGLALSWEHRKPGWLFLGLVMTAWVRSFGRAGERR